VRIERRQGRRQSSDRLRLRPEPVRPDATYDGKKGPWLQVRSPSTCVPGNDGQLLTAPPAAANALRGGRQGGTPMLDQWRSEGLTEELLADTL